MKYAYLLSLFLFSLIMQGHGQKQAITVVRLKNGSAIVECKKETKDYFSDRTTESETGAYWITAQTNLALQAGLKKAISWAALNEEHQKEFEKEIIRIRVTKKETYEFYNHYIPGFSDEAKLIFEGHGDGSFTLTLDVAKDVVSITLISTEDVENFLNLLQGKSANKEIDDIFH